MKYLKKFNESEIDSICEKYNIKNYTVIDGIVNVNGDVYLYNKQLTKIPLKFGIVTGNFDCGYNQLTSLEGCPSEVVGSFYSTNNKLTSLEGCPKVGGNFDCGYNQLTSLEGCPSEVVGNFYCYKNQLTSLEGCPSEVGGDFYCNNNQLTSLEDFPEVGGNFNIKNNPIYKWWQLINDKSKIEIFQDLNINSEDPDKINQQKIDYILNY